MPRRRMIQVISIILAVLAGLTAAGLGFIGNYFYNYALNPYSDVKYSTGGGSQEAYLARLNAAYVDPNPGQWLDDNAAEVSLTSRDGLTLHAYEVAGTNGNWAIVCHGYQGDAPSRAAEASHFSRLGYNVLLPDARGHGESEGDFVGMGWPERLDILDWIDAILSKDPEASIFLYGVSMGGATVMMTAGEPLPPNVKLVIEDCGYTSAWDEFAGQLKELYGLPPFPVLTVTSLVTKLRAGYFLKEASAVDQLKKARVPMLFIHGSEDTFVPFRMLDEVYSAAASAEKEKLVIPGAEHAEASLVDPETYWNTVDAFIAKHMR